MSEQAGTGIQGGKLYWVIALVSAILLLAGSVFGVDWMNYFYGTESIYSFIAKPGITLLSFVLVLTIGEYRLEKRDWILLVAAFACMFPTDILMSIVPLSPAATVGGGSFL